MAIKIGKLPIVRRHIDDRSNGSGWRLKKLLIGVLMKKKRREEKRKDNQYKLKKAIMMAIAIGLNSVIFSMSIITHLMHLNS